MLPGLGLCPVLFGFQGLFKAVLWVVGWDFLPQKYLGSCPGSLTTVAGQHGAGIGSEAQRLQCFPRCCTGL